MSEPTPSGVYTPFIRLSLRRIGARTRDMNHGVLVMAAINATTAPRGAPDFDWLPAAAVEAGLRAEHDGADIIDIGGLPFYDPRKPIIDEDEELGRVLPVVVGLRAQSDVAISVDTWRPRVAQAVIDAGADIINDTSCLYDPALAEVVADSDASLIIAHSLAWPPNTPVRAPSYADVTAEVAATLARQVDVARQRGVPEQRIMVDPGHDLNKNTYHSLMLTRRLSQIASLGWPTLVAVPDKQFIADTLAVERTPRDMAEGNLATIVVCILNGARLVRVHDVPSTVRAVRMVEAIMGWRPPAEARHNLA